jgi:hypothetical protein
MSSLTAAWYSTEYQEISKIVDEVMNAGFSAEQILSQVSTPFACQIFLNTVLLILLLDA